MIYVLDTSVLLSDPKALERLKNKHLVIPLVVLEELEAKRSHPELGYSARENLRRLENLRKMHSLVEQIVTSPQGSLRVEINHIDDSELPQSFRTPQNDNRILACAFNLAKEGPVTLLTKDLPLRLKASVLGVSADDYNIDIVDTDWTGLDTLEVGSHVIDDLYKYGQYLYQTDLPENTSVILKSGNQSGLARVVGKGLQIVRDSSVFEVRGRSAEQKFAIDLLKDPQIKIASLGGKAGTGKSLLALAAGLDAVFEQRTHKKIVVFRPLYAVGGQELGYLPGSAEEKMAPWTAAVIDALEAFCGPNVIEAVLEDELLEVSPLTHIRGRTLSNTFIIIDEAQNLEKMVLLTALSRVGENSKVVLTHDVAQRDNLRVGKHDGISSVVATLTGNKIFGHISLQKSERSEVAELVSSLID